MEAYLDVIDMLKVGFSIVIILQIILLVWPIHYKVSTRPPIDTFLWRLDNHPNNTIK